MKESKRENGITLRKVREWARDKGQDPSREGRLLLRPNVTWASDFCYLGQCY